MLKSITAVFECDGCGTCFEAEIDPAMNIVPGWSPYEAAEEAIRGDGFCSVVDGPALGDTRHFCKSCTEKEDEGSVSSVR